MRLALTATCITTLATLLAAEARADTTVSTATAAPLTTSTAGNIAITADGSITPTAAASAITINSNNTVTSAGKITFSGLDNSAAIVASGGLTSSITNSGAISLDETYTRTDTNADTVLDGPYALGTNRYGIRIDGTTPFTGAINNTGAITVRGNASAAIYATAPLVGNFTTNTGAITVTGNNTYGVRLGTVTGNVAMGSAISMVGGNATGFALTGNVTGQVVVHGSITTTGYSATLLPADITKLTPENVQQSGSAMTLAGNVTGGVLIAAAPTDLTNTTIDADNDGIADATEGTAAFINYGGAPALLVGSTGGPTTLGVFAGNTNGLVVNGNIAGTGVYSGISATGIQIGGLGSTVTINGGIAIGGQVAGSSNGAVGTGLLLGAGAITPQLTVAGSIAGNASATVGGTSVGIDIASGASLPAITNSGTISATTTAATGLATAIRDNSGTLTSLTNNGAILAASTDGTARAIDTSANATGLTYTQALASATQTQVPALVGAIVTGSGNDVINLAAGQFTSNVKLGAGNDTLALSGNAAAVVVASLGDGNDSVSVSGTATLSGTIDFGAGNNTLTIGTGASFSGQFVNSDSNIAVALNGGTLAFNTPQPVTMGSLAVAGGTIGVVVNPSTGAHTLINVTGATTFTAPTTLKVSIATFGETAGSTTLLQSGSLTGSSKLALAIDNLPFLLNGALTGSDAAGTVGLTIQRKTATELNLRRSEAAAYDAVFTAIQANPTLSTLFLGLTDRDSTLLRYDEMLPDHQGGVFDVLSEGSRALAPTENVTPWGKLGRISLWAQQALWDEHQDATDTPGNAGSGWGLVGGGDVAIGAHSRVGLSIGYIHGSVRDSGSNGVDANQFGGGIHWYSAWGGLRLTAYGSAGYVRLKERRSLSGLTDSVPTVLTSNGDWNGLNAAAGAKASYEWTSRAFYLRPSALLTYNRLTEGSHDETGGGAGFDLSVAKRTSSELAATGQLAAGIRFGNQTDPDATTFRFELEGGRRQILNSNLDGTTAHFVGGNDFTLLPEDRKSGWNGGANASIGSAKFRFIAGALVETRSNGQRIISGRFGFRGSF